MPLASNRPADDEPTPPEDDAEFQADIKLARAGDQDALGRVLARYQRGLMRRARNMIVDMRGVLRASDVVQSTYVDAVKQISNFKQDSEKALGAWLGRMLENNVQDKRRYFRAAKRRPKEDVLSLSDGSDSIPDPNETQNDENESTLGIAKAIQTLPPQYRRVLILIFVEGRTNQEIAKIIGRTEGATRVVVSRARSRLMVALGMQQPPDKTTP